MQSKPFRFHPEAREDFRESIRWYRAGSLITSTEFRRAVGDSVQLIAQAPQRWPTYLFGTRRFVLQRFPFSVIYLDDPDLVTIIIICGCS
jgi:plasmid stabilization system protein ParE